MLHLINYNRTDDVEYIISIGHTAPTIETLKVYQGGKLIKDSNIGNIAGSYEYAKLRTFYTAVSSTDISLDNRSVLRFEYGGLALYPFHNF
jgi:hypothetical protein